MEVAVGACAFHYCVVLTLPYLMCLLAQQRPKLAGAMDVDSGRAIWSNEIGVNFARIGAILSLDFAFRAAGPFLFLQSSLGTIVPAVLAYRLTTISRDLPYLRQSNVCRDGRTEREREKKVNQFH